jgi:hypothetical protein
VGDSLIANPALVTLTLNIIFDGLRLQMLLGRDFMGIGAADRNGIRVI